MFKVPEKYRLTYGHMRSSVSDKNNGMFIIPKGAIKYYCKVSDDLDWEHVSVSIKKKNDTQLKRCPTWEEMCMIKDLFWDKDDVVVQFHPAEKDYINNHPYVLHLWRSMRYEMPVPLPEMIGLKALNKKVSKLENNDDKLLANKRINDFIKRRNKEMRGERF